MEITNFYKGTDNVTIHAIEHDIVLTHDIIFDYMRSGKISPVLNLNYWTGSISMRIPEESNPRFTRALSVGKVEDDR